MNTIKRANTSYHVVPISNDYTEDLVESDVVDGATNYDEFGKIYMFGEKTSGFKSNGFPQNYAKLRQHHIQNRTLFSDESFLPNNIAMPKVKGNVVWKRPAEIVENPEFIIDGATRFDIVQGELGDCWFLAAVANLTTNEKLFSFVVPNDQSLSENYAGIFHFRFWQYGRWIDIVIDDRLPTIDNKIIYLHSSNPREFWPPLLEKAYAKLYGSYKNIEGGQISEGLEDLCGGLSESYPADRLELFEIMEMSHERASFMGCSIVSSEVEGTRPDGLLTQHAYSVTDLKKIRIGETDLCLIRLRNPWGNSVEWNGLWSDLSESWNTLPKDLAKQLRSCKPDGEFWMEFSDFQKCFTYVDIVHLNPSSFTFGQNKNWKVSMFEGSWVPNISAGGGVRFESTFYNNPQYHLTVRGNNRDATYEIVIGLMQKNRRVDGQLELPLELDIYRVQSKAGKLLDKEYLTKEEPVVNRLDNGIRQLTIRVALPVGRYCIIPSTWTPNVYASYLLRIYSEADANVIENDVEIGYSSDAVLTHATEPGDEEFNNIFKKMAQDNNEVGWYGVKKALNKKFGTKRIFCFMKPKISFSKDTCKNIVALWDMNYSGRLDSEEFERLLKDVATLNGIFRRFDKDHSGKLDGFELRNLLSACGYKVNRQILTIIMLRYGYNGSMSFESFVVCAFKLKTMIDEFHRRKTIETNDHINVNRGDWLQTTLYS